jgi:putative redox protein
MTLKSCRIVLKVMGAENQQGFQESLDLASKNCSIYQTIAHVAEMETELQFG